MNDIFKHWGIEHLSPSSINMYIADPLQWIIHKLCKIPMKGSPAMWRGNIVDQSVGSYLGLHHEFYNSRSLSQIQQDGLKSLDDSRSDAIKNKEFDVEKDQDKYDKERRLLPKYIKTTTDFYSQLGEADTYQEKVMYEVYGLPIPIIGYLDLKYEKDGFVRDIKTSGRNISELSHSVSRQLALYGHCTGLEPLADYVVCNLSRGYVTTLGLRDAKGSLDELERGAFSIMKLLSISDDINDLTSLFFPNLDDFRWSSLRDEELVKSLYRRNVK